MKLRGSLFALLAFPSFALVAPLVLAGCGSSYCQSGPKYGTQCYSSTGAGNPATLPGGPSTPPQERRR